MDIIVHWGAGKDKLLNRLQKFLNVHRINCDELNISGTK